MKRIKKMNRITILTFVFILISCVGVFAVSFNQLYFTDSQYYTSSNEKVAFIDKDYVHVIGDGTTTITAVDDNSTWNFVVEGSTTSDKKTFMEFAYSFPESVRSYSDEEKVRRLLLYMSDNNFQFGQTANEKYNLLSGKAGDCQAYAGFFKNIIRRCGIECESVGSGTHAYNKVYINNRWYEVDSSYYIKYPNNRTTYLNNLFN